VRKKALLYSFSLISSIFLDDCTGPDSLSQKTLASEEQIALVKFWDCMFAAAHEAKTRTPEDKAAMIRAISPLCEKEYVKYVALVQREPPGASHVQDLEHWRSDAARRAVTVETAPASVR